MRFGFYLEGFTLLEVAATATPTFVDTLGNARKAQHAAA